MISSSSQRETSNKGRSIFIWGNRKTTKGLTDLIQRRKKPLLNKVKSGNKGMYSNC